MDHDDHAGHTAGQHAGHSTAMFKNRFWLTLLLSVPVVFFSPMAGHLLGYATPRFPGSAWIPPLPGAVILVHGGQPFLKGGWQELNARQPGMMLLISMAIMLLGHWIEMRALGSDPGALDALAVGDPVVAGSVATDNSLRVRVTAVGAGTDVAMESAGVAPAGNDPRAVLSMADLSHASYHKRWQNLGWATGYDAISVPLGRRRARLGRSGALPRGGPVIRLGAAGLVDCSTSRPACLPRKGPAVPALRHLPAAGSVLRLGGLLVRVLAMIAGIPGMHVTGGPAAAMVPAGSCSHPN